ncbi:RNA/RNP complex-1-interacting phosphatase-like [Tubulanus polymorphus]|uniref:RNA/RNP complex-1-interacting phosphatase-like n=1 Tax=Tubulanus polymorphus TaxID=672921 RepID=UPI003DA5FF0E
MAPNNIPNRWEPYTPCGEPIEGTRFISFKVPLKESLNRKLKESDRFNPSDLIKIVQCKADGLGLIIDLTNTNRYYNREEIIKHGVEYKKIHTEGQKVPSKKVQESFMNAVDEFLQKNSDNQKLIGIHCTHGVNRTGYLVCRYMIDRMNFDAETAIKAFNDARGHEMERPHYLADLRGEPYVDPPDKRTHRMEEQGKQHRQQQQQQQDVNEYWNPEHSERDDHWRVNDDRMEHDWREQRETNIGGGYNDRNQYGYDDGYSRHGYSDYGWRHSRHSVPYHSNNCGRNSFRYGRQNSYHYGQQNRYRYEPRSYERSYDFTQDTFDDRPSSSKRSREGLGRRRTP